MLRSCARVISRSATAQLPTRMGPTNLHTSICNNRTFTTTTTYRSPAASSSSPASSSSSSSPPGKVSAFGGTRRVDSAAFAGPIAPAADAAKSEERLALAKKRHAPILNPIHVSRGSSHRSARMHRELHAPNLKDLNHSLAHYIQRSHTWNDLVALCFDHMHHMTHHNLLRAMQKLVKLSPTRQILDHEHYNKFGLFMVQVETRMHELDSAGLMQVGFMPYHYLRQCLKQMYLAQDRARTNEVNDPVAARYARRGERLSDEAEAEADAETRSIGRKIDLQTEEQESKYQYVKTDEKSKKLQAKERRAGRVFQSAAQATREASRGHTDFGRSPKNI